MLRFETTRPGIRCRMRSRGRPSEAQPPELLGVALPFLRHLHVQREEDARVDERLDAGAGAGADILQPRALLADDDRLLTVALHDDVGVDVREVAVFALGDVCTTTAMECGSSSRTPSRAASRMISAIRSSVDSSVTTPSGYSAVPTGMSCSSSSVSTSSWSFVSAESGMTAAQSSRSWSTSISLSAIWSRAAASVFVTIATF